MSDVTRIGSSDDAIPIGKAPGVMATSDLNFKDYVRGHGFLHDLDVRSAECCRQELAAAVVGEGLRPLAGESTPEALQSLLDACWQREPSSRPTASQIVAALSQMQV